MNTKSAIAEIREMIRDIRRDHMLSGCINDVKTVIVAFNTKRNALKMALKALEEKETSCNSAEKLYRAADLLREHCKSSHYCCVKCLFYRKEKSTCRLMKAPHTWAYRKDEKYVSCWDGSGYEDD